MFEQLCGMEEKGLLLIAIDLFSTQNNQICCNPINKHTGER